jgi:hypothetical protein
MTGSGVRPEIWSYGPRNPWRYSFDSNGDLYIADVGQNDIEGSARSAVNASLRPTFCARALLSCVARCWLDVQTRLTLVRLRQSSTEYAALRPHGR